MSSSEAPNTAPPKALGTTPPMKPPPSSPHRGGVVDMDCRKHQPSGNATSVSMVPLDFPSQALEKVNSGNQVILADLPCEAPIDIDMRELYFLIMHFLSHGPLKRTLGELCNELQEHQVLPRRYHDWYSRGGFHSGEENDHGVSLPLGYLQLVESNFEVDYGSEQHASIVYKTLAVDKELQPYKVRREMTVSGGKLVVRFEAVEARFLRASFSACVDLMVLATKLVEEYGVSKEEH